MSKEVNIDVLIEGMHEQAKAISELNDEIADLHSKIINDLQEIYDLYKTGGLTRYHPIYKKIEKWVKKRDEL